MASVENVTSRVAPRLDLLFLHSESNSPATASAPGGDGNVVSASAGAARILRVRAMSDAAGLIGRPSLRVVLQFPQPKSVARAAAPTPLPRFACLGLV
jgi:hypothetical protein